MWCRKEFSQSTCLLLQKIEVDRREKLEDLEFSTSEILEVREQESKMLLTKSNHLSRKLIKAFQKFLECFLFYGI